MNIDLTKKTQSVEQQPAEQHTPSGLSVFGECTAKDIGLVIGSTVLSLLAASTVFIAALAWNEALKEEVARYNSDTARWVYVLIVTIAVSLLAVPLAIFRVAIAEEGGPCFASLTGAMNEYGNTTTNGNIIGGA